MGKALCALKDMKILVDWSNIESFDDFYDCFLPQVKAPEWHGRNLNALSDSLVVGDINGLEPPFCVINANSKDLSGEAEAVFSAVADIYAEANAEGRQIRVLNQ